MKKIKILYISAISNQVSGGTAVMNRNLQLIKNVPNTQVEVVQVLMQSKVQALIEAFSGGNFILSRADEEKIVRKVQKEHFDFVFQEGTSSGHLAQALSKTGTKLIAFAHNVETMLYEDRLSSYKFNILEAIKLMAIRRNEKKTVKYCGKLIALTKRDSDNFMMRFQREADSIIPISFVSNIEEYNRSSGDYGKYCLFVGSNFFPNIEGMNWFIREIAPHINLKIKVVGTCCKGLNPIPESLADRVEYLGLVDELGTLYKDATMVIAPILKGSGMKTKTIEAMSYGKSIFGTDECFQGIECDYNKIGGLCNTPEEFINAINNYSGDIMNKYTCDLFESKYSNEAVQVLFNRLF